MKDILAQIIKERRTVKPDTFSGELIADIEIQEILEQANWAPSHGYTEPWRFVVYKGEALKALGRFMADFNQPNKDADDFNEVRYNKLLNKPLLASHVIGIAMRPNSNPKIPEIEETCAVAMAVQNMWLYIHSIGYGAIWSTPGFAFSGEFRDFLKFDDSHKSMGLLYIGKPTKANPTGRRVSTIETKVRWES
jgi:nitroreductase